MKKYKIKSLKVNMFLNSINSVMSIIYPLISFPYVSKVLGLYNLGRYNFATSIVSYFSLIAALGISTYAIREGSKIREDIVKIKKFADQMFSIRVISTTISLCTLLIVVVLSSKLHDYFLLLILLSLNILFQILSVDWIYSIYEDYLYITIRSISFQVISLVLLFTLVKSENDLYMYACIGIVSSCGASLLNFFRSKQYCKINFTKNIEWNKHFKPIFILFGMGLTVAIYVSSDITILGWLCGEEIVGIYSTSTKIYTIVKNLLSAVLVVSIPRLCSLIEIKSEFINTAKKIYSSLITLVLPSIVGIIILRREIVLIVANSNYLKATSSLFLLSIALLFCMSAWFYGQCILVPLKREKEVFIITLISAVVNVILNFILIPLWKENAAAFTTIIAEAISYLLCMILSKKIVNMHGIVKVYIKSGLGCIAIIIYSYILKIYVLSDILYIALTISGSIIIYVLVEIIIKNEGISDTLNSVLKKLKIKI